MVRKFGGALIILALILTAGIFYLKTENYDRYLGLHTTKDLRLRVEVHEVRVFLMGRDAPFKTLLLMRLWNRSAILP